MLKENIDFKHLGTENTLLLNLNCYILYLHRCGDGGGRANPTLGSSTFVTSILYDGEADRLLGEECVLPADPLIYLFIFKLNKDRYVNTKISIDNLSSTYLRSVGL